MTGIFYAQGAVLAARVRPDLVHANDYNTMWIGIAAKLALGSRLVYDAHELWPDRNGRSEWRPWLLASEGLFLRVADATLTASPGYAALMARRYRVTPPLVVRNIPERPVAHDAVPTRGPSSSLGALFVYVGGLMPGRGLEQTIRALTLVPGARLRLIGPGAQSYRAMLQQAAVSAGVADRVEFIGPVPPGAILPAIADADAGIMLIEPICRSYELTLPNKLFEYAAAGVPVLSSDLPVIGRYVRSHQLGEVVEPGDVDEIALAMRRLINPRYNAALRAHVTAFAREATWQCESRALAAVYRRLLLSSAGCGWPARR